MTNIWQSLKKPIFILAPMEDVTDTVFRQVIMQTGRPDLFFIEFTNVDGMFSKGNKFVSQRLLFDKKEKPIIAQVWGLQPKNYFKAAKQLAEMGYDGIDINMGCPQRNVTQRGACSALMKNHPLAKEIIQATKEGAQGLPVSVKTRIGYSSIILEEWLGFLLEQNLDALTVHGRTVAEMSAVPAHWDQIGKAVLLRNKMKKNTLVIGNGDVKSLQEAKDKVKQYGLDGVMIGRGIFENPWLFNSNVNIKDVTLKHRVELLLTHLDLWEKIWGKEKHFPVLKKYFKIYVSGFDGAQHMRIALMEAKNAQEVRSYLASFI